MTKKTKINITLYPYWIWIVNLGLLASIVVVVNLKIIKTGEREVEAMAKELGVPIQKFLSMSAQEMSISNRMSIVTVNDTFLVRPSKNIVTENGDIFVLDYAFNRVIRLTLDGIILQFYGSTGLGPGELSSPVDFDVGTDGTVYVAERYGRISIYNRDGTLDTVFNTPTGSIIYKLCITHTFNILVLRRITIRGSYVFQLEHFNREGAIEKVCYRYILEDHWDDTPNLPYLISSTDGIFLAFRNKYLILKFTHNGNLVSAVSREMDKLRLPKSEVLKEKSKAQRLRERNIRYQPRRTARYPLRHITWDPIDKELLVITYEETYLTEGRRLNIDIYKSFQLVSRCVWNNPGVFTFRLSNYGEKWISTINNSPEEFGDDLALLCVFDVKALSHERRN